MLQDRRLYLGIGILIALCVLGIQPARAQENESACAADSKQYASWFGVADSLQMNVAGSFDFGDVPAANAEGYFALVNKGQITDSDYYFQALLIEEMDDEFVAMLVKEELVAIFDRGWKVEQL